jgi:hypothetical protein
MVLSVSFFRKTYLIDMVLLVSSFHMQGSYEQAFCFFPHQCKPCKDLFFVFLHKVKIRYDEAFDVFFII